MSIRRTRLAVAAITGAIVASSIASVTFAAEPRAITMSGGATPTVDGGGGSTAGAAACTFEVAASDEVFGASAVVVPEEEFWVAAEGWAPGGAGDLLAEDLDRDREEAFDITFAGDGRLLLPFFFAEGFDGSWRLTLSQDAPPCSAVTNIEVLPLLDILDSKFLKDIKWLFVEGITSGCSADAFCPDGRVTRGQMATFLARALNLPPTATDYFTDDETNKHEQTINRLRAAGITFGCTATRFCPDGIVTRGQMASFLVRAFDLPTTGTDYFTDDETNKHEANINRLRASGITFGCSATTFCPNGQVTRGQMSAFLHRAID